MGRGAEGYGVLGFTVAVAVGFAFGVIAVLQSPGGDIASALGGGLFCAFLFALFASRGLDDQ